MTPPYLIEWLSSKGWTLHPYQQQMLDHRGSALLIAPTGGGKTLSGFLPSLADIHETQPKGLHTLYISPLKALTHDIERNLLRPISEMQLEVTVESRTGDTPSAKRQRQRKHPPNILLTTPESLMLMLSYADCRSLFKTLRTIIIDEVHSFASSKRGDFTALAISRLQTIAPQHRVIGLSATVAEPNRFKRWLGPNVTLIEGKTEVKPEIRLLNPTARMPYGGHMATYAIEDIYKQIKKVRHSLIFVNTRAQSELIFQQLWEVNREALPIAVYHGSLSKEQRRKTESMMARGEIRAVVATSALELGIDWGDVELVIQVGAPKGVSRLLQRIGRANHRLDEPSRALLVPGNRFEALECEAAMEAIAAGKLDGPPEEKGSLDVIVQYIINCACSEPVHPDELYSEITRSYPYQHLRREVFDQLFQFAIDGGYSLRAYERYKRLEEEEGLYRIASRLMAQRHRQNIGTIVEAARLKVKKLGKGKRGSISGTVEEYFAQQLTPGDTFLFGGEVLEYVGVTEMTLEARPAAKNEPKIPSYVGGQMPLSTFLADGVRSLLAGKEWSHLPQGVQDWLELQAHYSVLPDNSTLLIEHFPKYHQRYTLLYTFEGRKVNNTLGMLLTRRMERAGLKPLSFTVSDYGLSISSIEPVTEAHMRAMLTADILGGELEEWIAESPMLKRSFRQVATVAGLAEQQYHGQRKTMKQMTFSTDLIYDVLMKYEPDHVLLAATRQEAERELLDVRRLSDTLAKFEQSIAFVDLDRASPLAIPIVLDVRQEQVKGSGLEALLAEASAQDLAETMMEDIRERVEIDRHPEPKARRS